MARRVFFSFHYDKDVNRANVVRNSWVVQGTKEANFIDKAAFERVRQQGEQAVYNWIDKQLEGTSVTVVLIGAETLSRPFVQYEICQSINRGNAIIGVYIDGIRDMITQMTSSKGNPHTVIGSYKFNNASIYFDSIADGIYDFVYGNGYQNLGGWIEVAAKKHNK
jgi:hypothetical protein